MRNLIRSPIAWLVVAEFVVVGALIVVAWDVIGGATRSVFASPPLNVSVATDTSLPLPDIPETGRPGPRGPLPGLNLESMFWRLRLQHLNGDQIVLEQLEWRIIHGAMDAVKRYLETVVLPAIQHAEHAGGAALL
jgi:hypothetical protein